MKFLKAFLFLGALFFLGSNAKAADYVVTLTTYVPTASAADFVLGSYPNISGGANMAYLMIANAGATAQDVSVYDTCTSSTAATLAGKVSLSAAIQTQVIELPRRLWKLTSPCFTKSATGSAVYLNVIYE